MKNLCRSGWVTNLHIMLCTQLQETLQPGRGVLRALPLVAVRQQHHEPRLAHPLGLARAEELVDDDLRAVDEVAELRLPDAEHVRRLEGVAQLEAQHAVLGEEGVVDVHGRGPAREPAPGLRSARAEEAGRALEERRAPPPAGWGRCGSRSSAWRPSSGRARRRGGA